ncbi:hypothetical protein ABWH92_00155 [Ahrensia marina]|uniref:hypothetical protein n=1 Tax=Ahrensia marina TaxID=1514904 RepID=UPI0035CFFE84
MTLATSGAQQFDDTSHDATSYGTDTAPSVKTALDCDILTLARDARAHERGAHNKAAEKRDPLDALYKPLGNKDVACVLEVAGR